MDLRARFLAEEEERLEVPSVYYEYAWPSRTPQESCLSVILEIVDVRLIHKPAKMLERSKEGADAGADKKSDNKLMECMIQKGDTSGPWPVPDELMFTFPTARRGCYRMCLSTSGQYLVCACDSSANTFEMRVYDLRFGQLHCVCEGHSALVYDLFWFSGENNEEIVVSCSGDGRCLLFVLPRLPTEAVLFPHIALYHPSHVYSARLHPISTSSTMVMVTGGFGFGMRIW